MTNRQRQTMVSSREEAIENLRARSDPEARAALRAALAAAVRTKQFYTGTDVTLDAATFDTLLDAAADLIYAAALPDTGAGREVPATFPLDLDAFVAGLDSPNHSDQSRRDWCRLFFRDMQRSAALGAGSTDEVGRLRELSDAATPGPWIRRWASLDVHHMTGDDALQAQADIDFAVAACAYVRAVLPDKPSGGDENG